MNQLLKANVIAALPGGHGGRNGIVYKGTMETRDNFVALKVSNYTLDWAFDNHKKEFDTSVELSKLMPNTALYHAMVDVEQFPKNPTFAMELFIGPLLSFNNIWDFAQRFAPLLTQRSVDQLEENLTIALENGWSCSDLQCLVAYQSQVIKNKPVEKGDIILMDFDTWSKTTNPYPQYFMNAIRNLKDLYSKNGISSCSGFMNLT